MLIVDADSHFDSLHLDWTVRMPREFLSRAPKRIIDTDGITKIVIDGIMLPNAIYEGSGRWATKQVPRRWKTEGLNEPIARIADMDEEGISISVMYPHLLLFHANATSDWRLANAIAKTWNTYIAEEVCRRYPGRLRFSALLPMSDMGAAVEEAYRAVMELEAVGLALPTNYNNRTLDDPYFEPLFAAAEALNVPICVHGSNGGNQYVNSVGAHNNWLITHSLALPMGVIHAFASILCNGSTVRFPKLKFLFLEGGVGWLPFFIRRLDEHAEQLPALVPYLDSPPSEFLRSGRCYISIESGESLHEVVNKFGSRILVFASDYGHWDSVFPQSVSSITSDVNLSAEAKNDILAGNSRLLYDIHPVSTE